MASLAMGVVGAGIGAAFGNPQLGFAIGVTLAGVLFPPKQEDQERGRIDDLRASGSTYGAYIPLVWGKARLGTNCLWSSDLSEHVTKKKVGGKGGGGATQKTYSYTVSMLNLVCRGPVGRVTRIWGEDKLIYDIDGTSGEVIPLPENVTLFYGTEDQLRFSPYETAVGTANCPAHRGYCLVGFDDFDLSPWRGRRPSLNVEVSTAPGYQDRLSGHSGVIVYYKMDSTPGLLLDSSPNGYDLASGSATTRPGLHGDGSLFTEYVDADAVVGPVAAFDDPEITLVFSCKWDGSSALSTDDFFYRHPSNGEYSCKVHLDWFSQLLTWSSHLPGGTYIHNVVPLTRNTDWKTFVCTAKVGGDTVVYQDGVEIDRLGTDVGITDFQITSNANNMFRVSGGGISTTIWDEIAVYNSEWTPEEVEDAYNSNGVTVADILTDLFLMVGLEEAQFDVSAATDVVDGWVLSQKTAVREAIKNVLMVYQVDLIEVDGQIIAKKRGGSVVATLGEADLGSYRWSGSPQTDTRVEAKRIPDLELPWEMSLTYFSYQGDYQQCEQHANRVDKPHVDDRLTLGTALVFDGDDFPRQQIERLLYTLWVEREQFAFVLQPEWIWLAPSDVVSVPVAGGTARVRLLAMDTPPQYGPIACQAVLDSIDVLTQTAGGAEGTNPGYGEGVATGTTLRVASMNALRDEDAPFVGVDLFACGTTGGSWPGCLVYMSRDGTLYEELVEITDPTTMGTCDTVLGVPASPWRIDRVSSVDVHITQGQGSPPASCSYQEMLNGANAALVGDEVIQYMTVTPLGGNVYRLTNLLRGRRGTEWAVAAHGASEDWTELDNGGAAVRMVLGESLVNRTVYFKAVQYGTEIADATAVPMLVTGDELKPYAGYALSGSRAGDDLTIDWRRRTRSGGAWSDHVDVDQPELTEAYEVDIYNGVSVVRTISSLTTSTAAYSGADQTTDFGSPQTEVDVKVYQIGKLGRGYPLEGTV